MEAGPRFRLGPVSRDHDRFVSQWHATFEDRRGHGLIAAHLAGVRRQGGPGERGTTETGDRRADVATVTGKSGSGRQSDHGEEYRQDDDSQGKGHVWRGPEAMCRTQACRSV